jgi:hypothetical protein
MTAASVVSSKRVASDVAEETAVAVADVTKRAIVPGSENVTQFRSANRGICHAGHVGFD